MRVVKDSFADVMQVCRNGHVITDLLHTFPERALSHCDRCGASTLDRCPTCGLQLPGATFVPESWPIGERQPPQFCSRCGASFPWTRRRPTAGANKLAALEVLLRKLPRVARQLRVRHANRPAWQIEDEHDLEDLLRALLPLSFEDIRLENRTPAYATGSRTDFLLGPSGIALTAKLMRRGREEAALREGWREDIAYYRRRGQCKALVSLVYDPAQLLFHPEHLEKTWASLSDDLPLRAVVAS
jgi:REase_DpnII-MboI/Uncharacterized protein conserved in bacteria (DUF2321)